MRGEAAESPRVSAKVEWLRSRWLTQVTSRQETPRRARRGDSGGLSHPGGPTVLPMLS